MKKDWKEKIIEEIDAYIQLSASFSGKWSKEKLSELSKNVLAQFNDNYSKRQELLGHALEFWQQKEQSDKNYKKVIREEIKTIKVKLLDENAKNCILYLDEQTKATLNDALKDYFALQLGGACFENYDKFGHLIFLLLIIGGKNLFNLNIFACLTKLKIDETVPKCFTDEYKSQFVNTDGLKFDLSKIKDPLDKTLFPFNCVEMLSSNWLRFFLGLENTIKFYGYKIVFSDIDRSELSLPIGCEFLTELKSDLLKQAYTSPFDFAIKFWDKHGLSAWYDAKKLKELYEKSPDEVMILDQRYYYEQQIEEARQRREAEEDYYAEQLKLQKKQASDALEQSKRIAEQQLRENNRIAEQQLRENKRIAEEQRIQNEKMIENQHKQTIAVYDTQITALEQQVKQEMLRTNIDQVKVKSLNDAIYDLQREKRGW